MGDMLSQAEIDALLGGGGDSSSSDDISDDALLAELSAELGAPSPGAAVTAGGPDIPDDFLTDDQKDILGEIGNISMGTAATTLFALLNQKVMITTPVVSVVTWDMLTRMYERPSVGIRVDYKEGLRGSNILVLKHEDVKIISNLMMGGDGAVDPSEELTELDLSAIGEAMNQMVGSSSTSLSSMTKMKIDIDTPQAFQMDFGTDDFFDRVGFSPDEAIVIASFKMEIGTLIDSNIMQILPKDFAVDMVAKLRNDMLGSPAPAQDPAPAPAPAPAPVAAAPAPAAPPPPAPAPVPQQPAQPYPPAPQPPYPQPAPYPQQAPAYDPYAQAYPYPPQYPPQQPAYAPPAAQQNVSPVQFQSFDAGSVMQQKENIGIIMDVPLEITVELGRTRKKIKEILEFSPGSIIELDKLAGEPIDILVNGKFVAKGEVVVIDENFGIRITDIIGVEERI